MYIRGRINNKIILSNCAILPFRTTFSKFFLWLNFLWHHLKWQICDAWQFLIWVICMLNHTQTLQICWENSTRHTGLVGIHCAAPFEFLQCKIYMSAEVVTSSGGTYSPHSAMKIRSQLKLLSPLELAETLQDCPCSQILSLSLCILAQQHPVTRETPACRLCKYLKSQLPDWLQHQGHHGPTKMELEQWNNAAVPLLYILLDE